jgi:ABC-2 type transport system ATP-binding protein
MLTLIEEISAHATVFYSTHILDDVERISDTVVMISRGRTVAHGALDDILSVSELDYTVRLRGNTSVVQARLSDEPWVDSVEIREHDDSESWDVHLSDESAGNRLVPIFASDESCNVIEFHASDRRLEDAYLELVGTDDGV